MDELVYSVISDFQAVQEKFVGLTLYNVIKDCKALGIKEREKLKDLVEEYARSLEEKRWLIFKNY